MCDWLLTCSLQSVRRSKEANSETDCNMCGPSLHVANESEYGAEKIQSYCSYFMCISCADRNECNVKMKLLKWKRKSMHRLCLCVLI